METFFKNSSHLLIYQLGNSFVKLLLDTFAFEVEIPTSVHKLESQLF